MNDVTAEAEEAAEEVPAEEIKRNNIDDILLSMSLHRKKRQSQQFWAKRLKQKHSQ